MKKIVIVSDTHGKTENLLKIDNVIKESDYVFFLGDMIADITKYQREAGITEKPEFIIVKGNCDFFSKYPDEEVVEVEGVRMLLTHGSSYGVKGYAEALFTPARTNNCQAVFYGHTHVADIIEDYGTKLINPGSLTAPRGKGKPSYAYAVVNDGKIMVSIVEIL